jgi:8-oxo-dGTP pyrophosphatase MutT (NUDIX family)
MDTGNVEPQAAVAMVRAQKPEASILLLRRSVRADDPWSGQWSFPGGRHEPGDPDLVCTALRELEEECGVRLGRECLQAALRPVIARRLAGPFILVAPFLFEVGDRLPTIPDPREVAGTRWIAQRALCDPAQHALRRVPTLPEELRFPGIALDDMPLWGFTYRLIADWLGLIPPACPSEQAGFEMASLVLEFLLSCGLTLKQGWTEPRLSPRTPAAIETTPVAIRTKIARVAGTIPAALVWERFGAPGNRVPRINVLEVRPEYICVTGLGYEEYLISAS